MLSEEQAIENLKDFKSINVLYGNKFIMFLKQLKKYQESTETVLGIIDRLQKENEEKDIKLKELQLRKDNQEKRFRQYKEDMDKNHEEIYEDLVSKQEEKDKQIDLIIEEYEFYDRINFKNFCEDQLREDMCIEDCKNCAKQYFENKAKGENK